MTSTGRSLETLKSLTIFSHLQKEYPALCYKFEREIFDRYAFNPGLGIKYVGKKLLAADKLLALVDGKWKDAKNLLV